MEAPRVREAARVILLDGRERVLLFRAVFAAWGDGDEPRSFWIAPGGGLHEGEEHVQAARRELSEEAGLHGAEIGPCCWLRSHTFRFFGNELVEQRERYFLCRVDSHEVDVSGLDAEESRFLAEHRWWTIEEMRSSGEAFVPADFADLLARIVAAGPPAEPITAGL